MSDKERLKIEEKLRDLFWSGGLFTSMFDIYDEAGRKEAAKYFAKELAKATSS